MSRRNQLSRYSRASLARGLGFLNTFGLLKRIIYGSLARSWLCSTEIRQRRQTKPRLIEIVMHTARAGPRFRLALSYTWKQCVFNAFALVQHKSAVPRLGVPRYQIINDYLLYEAKRNHAIAGMKAAMITLVVKILAL